MNEEDMVDCEDCEGKGHFNGFGKPSENPKDRKCMTCEGLGLVPKETVEDEDEVY